MDIHEDCFKFEMSLISNEKYKINASLVKHSKKYFCAYRCDHMQECNPRNYLTQLDVNLRPISHKRLSLEDGNTAFEDVRLFSFNKDLLAIYTAFSKVDESSWDGVYYVEIGVIDAETGIIKNQLSLKSLSLRYHEKNWVPYAYGGYLYLVTDFDPIFRVLVCPIKANFSHFEDFILSPESAVKWQFGELRGGTPFLPGLSNDEKWHYSFVHSSLYVPNGDDNSRFYFYTVVRLNHESKQVQLHETPLNYSQLHDTDTEYRELVSTTRDPSIRVVFPMGLIYWENGLLVSFGKDDCVSRVCFYPWKFILNLFRTI